MQAASPWRPGRSELRRAAPIFARFTSYFRTSKTDGRNQIVGIRRSPQQPDEIRSQVENALLTAFTSEPTCHDVRLVRLTSDMANTAVTNPCAPATGTMQEAAEDHWSRMLDVPPDNYADGDWSMIRGDVVLRGNLGNPAEVVRRVCAIAKRKGGTVAN